LLNDCDFDFAFVLMQSAAQCSSKQQYVSNGHGEAHLAGAGADAEVVDVAAEAETEVVDGGAVDGEVEAERAGMSATVTAPSAMTTSPSAV